MDGEAALCESRLCTCQLLPYISPSMELERHQASKIAQGKT